MTPSPHLAGFDELFKELPPEEKERCKNILRRYLELVVRIVDKERALTEERDNGTLEV